MVWNTSRLGLKITARLIQRKDSQPQQHTDSFRSRPPLPLTQQAKRGMPAPQRLLKKRNLSFRDPSSSGTRICLRNFTQDSSHHQENWTMFRFGNPNLSNLHLRRLHPGAPGGICTPCLVLNLLTRWPVSPAAATWHPSPPEDVGMWDI